MSVYDVRVEYRGELPKGGHRLKVCVLNLGMYIDGFRVYPSKKVEGTWVVYQPSTKIGNNGYKDVVEFAKNKPLWKEIAEACEQYIDIHTTTEPRERRLDDVSF